MCYAHGPVRVAEAVLNARRVGIPQLPILSKSAHLIAQVEVSLPLAEDAVSLAIAIVVQKEFVALQRRRKNARAAGPGQAGVTIPVTRVEGILRAVNALVEVQRGEKRQVFGKRMAQACPCRDAPEVIGGLEPARSALRPRRRMRESRLEWYWMRC